jgi:hypothetical protein
MVSAASEERNDALVCLPRYPRAERHEGYDMGGEEQTYRANLDPPPQFDAVEIEVTVWFQGEINLVISNCCRIVAIRLLAGVQSQSDTSVGQQDKHTRWGYYYCIGNGAPRCRMTAVSTFTADGGTKKVHPRDPDVLGECVTVMVLFDEVHQLANVIYDSAIRLVLLNFHGRGVARHCEIALNKVE